jgi:hypothetical protein
MITLAERSSSERRAVRTMRVNHADQTKGKTIFSRHSQAETA